MMVRERTALLLAGIPLLVLDAGQTRREMARRALEALRRVHERITGEWLS